jgi:hypothetical protein
MDGVPDCVPTMCFLLYYFINLLTTFFLNLIRRKICCGIIPIKPKGFDLPPLLNFLDFRNSTAAVLRASQHATPVLHAVPFFTTATMQARKRTRQRKLKSNQTSQGIEAKHYRRTASASRLTICSIAFHPLCAQNHS